MSKDQPRLQSLTADLLRKRPRMRPPCGVSAGLQGPSTRGGKGPAYHKIVTPSLWGEGPALRLLPHTLLSCRRELKTLLPLSHPSLLLPKDKQADRDAGEQHRDSSTGKVNSTSLQHKGPYPCGTVFLLSPGEQFHPPIFNGPYLARLTLCGVSSSLSLPYHFTKDLAGGARSPG